VTGPPAAARDVERLRADVEAVRWFHTMDLGAGVRTAGVYDPSRTLPRLGLPMRLDGRTVLDVGAWDGYYSFEMERRGASRVVATDHFCWGGGGWGTQAGFNLARQALGSGVEDRTLDVLDLSPEAVGGTYDIVLFLGVLYHLPNPLLALERVRSVTGGMLVLETEVDLLFTRRPAAAFFPGAELGDDPTNWWAPNVPAVLGMLRAAGYARAEVAWSRSTAFRAARWARNVVRGRALPPLRTLQQDRFVFHAWV
jgi:tRNA (mo5U34)-methyltransferase